MEYNLDNVRSSLEQAHITPNHIAQAIDKPDTTQVLEYKGMEVYFYLKRINIATPPYILMIVATPKKGQLVVENALKIYHSLGLDLEGKAPIEILEMLAERFGYKVTVGSKTTKFFLQESIPIPDLLPNDKFRMRIHGEEGDQGLFYIGYYTIEHASPPLIHYVIALFLRGNKYHSWVKRKGAETDFEIEAGLIKEYAEKRIAPALSGKHFRDKVYSLVHDFCFYCRERPKSLSKLSEEDIRDLFLVVVKTALHTGEAEAFHYDGKLDFKIVNPDNRYEIYTGEFKWWRGKSSADEIFHQAIRKHATGQEAVIFTLILNKTRDAAAVYETVKESYLAQKESMPDSFKSLMFEGSRELFGEFSVKVRGHEIPLILGLADLYHEKV